MNANGWNWLRFLKQCLRLTRMTKPSPSVLIVATRTWFRVFLTVSEGAFLVVWYPLVFGMAATPSSLESWIYQIESKLTKQPFLWLFLLAPLLVIPDFLAGIRILFTGETFTFDGSLDVLRRNEQPMARLSEIQGIQTRRILVSGGQGGNLYRLTVTLVNGKKLTIVPTDGEEEVTEVANEIARLTNVEVTKRWFTLV